MAMATAGRIKAGAAYIELTVDNSRLQRGLRLAQAKLQAMGQRFKAVGADLMQTFGMVSLPIAFATKKFADFDDKIRTLKAISGASATEIEGMRTYIRKLGATTAFTAHQVAEGTVELSRLGFETKDLKNGIKPVMDLVRATGEETHRLGEMSQYAAASLRIFDLDSRKFTDVCDVMGYAANRSAMNIADLGEAMKIAGPSAKTVNEDIRDTAAALMLMANAGIKGSLAGTSLRKIYQALAAQSGQVKGLSEDELNQGIRGKEQLAAMGVRIVDKGGNLRKAADIMSDLAKKVKAMKSGEKINFATDVFDLRGSLGALSMLNNSTDLKKFRKELNNTAGYVDKLAKEMETGLGGSIRLLVSSFQEVQLAIGEALYDTFGPILPKIATAVKIVANFIKANKKLVASIVAAIAIAGALGVAFFALGSIMKIIAFGLGSLSTGITLFAKVLTLPLKIIANLISLGPKITAAFLIIKKIALLPVGKIIKGAVFALVNGFLILKKVALGAFAVITSPAFIVGAALAAVVVVVGKLTGAWDMLKNSFGDIGTSFKESFAAMGRTFSEAFGIIKQALLDGDMEGAAKVFFASLNLIWQQGLYPLKKLWYSFTGFFKDSWSVITYGVSYVALQTWYGIKKGLASFANSVSSLWYKLVNVIGDAWDSTIYGLAKAANYIWSGLKIGFKSLGSILSSVWDSICNGLITAFDAAMAWLRKAWLKTKNFFKENKNLTIELQAIDNEVNQRRNARNAKARANRAKWNKSLNQEKEDLNDKNKNIDKELNARKARRFNETQAKLADLTAKGTVKKIDAEWDEALRQLDLSHSAELQKNALEKNSAINDSLRAAQQNYQNAKDFVAMLPKMKKEVEYWSKFIKGKITAKNAGMTNSQLNWKMTNSPYLNELIELIHQGKRKQAETRVQSDITSYEKQLAKKTAAYEDYLRKAQTDRVIDSNEKKELRTRGKEINGIRQMIGMFKNIQERIAVGSGEAIAKSSVTATGKNVGAWTFRELMANTGNTAADRTARATEQNVLKTEDIIKRFDNLLSILKTQGLAVYN